MKKSMIPEWILSTKEENQLSMLDKQKYYHKLREYCMKRKLTNTTPGATKISPKLKRPTNYIAKKLCNVLSGGAEVVTDGVENIPDGPVIFASTHQGILDNFVWIVDIYICIQ